MIGTGITVNFPGEKEAATIGEAISQLVEGRDLTPEEGALVMDEILSGKATEAQIGAFLTAMRIKGETPSEIAAFARVLRSRAVSARPALVGTLVDTCGTGGDGAGTFNISTVAAFITAAAGVPVVKHGNRGATSRCGSADLLEELGIPLGLEPARVVSCVEEVGIGFFYAPMYHGAMRYAAGPRREIGIRTVFNLLGPLANPAGADAQLLGVYDPALTRPVAEVLAELGTRRAVVVHGDGLDEIATTGKTVVSELRGSAIRDYTIDSSSLGIPTAKKEEIAGGTPAENAQILCDILDGRTGPRRDIAVVNAAASIYLGGRATDLADGIRVAEAALDSGRAARKLDDLVAFCREGR